MNEGKKTVKQTKTPNPVARHAMATVGGGGFGKHTDRKRAAKHGETRHKKTLDNVQETLNRDNMAGNKTGNIGYDNMLAVMKAAEAGQGATITLANEPIYLEIHEARFLAGKYKAFLRAGRQDKFLQYMSDPVMFDRLMLQLRQLIDKQKNFKGSIPSGQGLEEGRLESETPDPVVVISDPKTGKVLDRLNLSVAAKKYQLGKPETIKRQLAHQDHTTINGYRVGAPMGGQRQDATTQNAKTEGKIKGVDGKACWKGKRYAGRVKKADGTYKDRCIPVSESVMGLLPPESNHEATMALSELYRNAKYSMSLLKIIEPNDAIDGWVQANLTNAATMLDKVFHYLDYKKMHGRKPTVEQIEDDNVDGAEDGETDGSQARENLLLIIEYSIKLMEMIEPGDNLASWVSMKLTKASEAVSSAKHFIEYRQFEKHTGDMFESRLYRKFTQALVDKE